MILDAIHEIDYLTWFFGPVGEVSCRAARLSDLEIDVEDYAALWFRHSGGVCSEVHLDYLQQSKRRGCEIVGTHGTLVWQSDGKKPERCLVRLFTRDPGRWRVLLSDERVDAGEPYFKLMGEFVHALEGRETPDLLTGREALSELVVALSATGANERRNVVELARITGA